MEPNSYRIIAIANHLGVSSNSGHYISDVYNLKTKAWSSYDDNKVETLTEEQVLQKRARTGYIFFYHIHK
jgi:ubiquitin carboxyl-terminal hydrolase 26/29/37